MTVIDKKAKTATAEYKDPIGLNQEAIISLEYSYLKVPFEQLRRVVRNTQKAIDRDVAQIAQWMEDIQSGKLEEGKVGSLMERIMQVKGKIGELQEESKLYQRRMLMRLKDMQKILTEIAGQGSNAEQYNAGFPNYQQWHVSRLDRIIIDCLLDQGLIESSRCLAQSKGLGECVDIELYSKIKFVLDSLHAHRASECLGWCAENKVYLKKNQSDLEFLLRQQEFVELAKSRNLTEAINYGKRHFASWWETHEREIQQTLGLLAVGPETATEPYCQMYDKDRWDIIGDQFKRQVYQLYGLSTIPQLVQVVQAGMAALKTPQCTMNEVRSQPANPAKPTLSSKNNPDCPVCVQPLRSIIDTVPYSHHEHSTIVCRITGRVMDEDNPPMALPNGLVYSLEAMKEMAENNGGRIKCIRTGQEFGFSELRKCFIS